MSQKTAISLASFYIFNSELGTKEGEEEKKILFYYPGESPIDTKIKDIGLCEAIIKFTNTFTANDDSCQVLRTEKTTQLYYQPEPGYWMILTVSVPSEKRTTPPEDDSDEINEYRSDDVHDKVFRNVLKQAYNMYRLFEGTFVSTAADELEVSDAVPTKLIMKLNQFYSKYLLTLKLPSCDILDLFRSVQYLPLDQFLFLRINNFIQMIKSTFPAIKHCIFLYDDQLVWSEVNPTDLYSIYEYLVGTLFPTVIEREGSDGGADLQNVSAQDSSHHGAFVTGSETDLPVTPNVYIFNDDTCVKYQLIVYRAERSTLCMLIEDFAEFLSSETYNELHVFMGSQLTSIGSEIGDHEAATNGQINDTTPTGSSSGPRFLFFNELNLKHSGTLHMNKSNQQKQSWVPAEVMNLIADLYEPTMHSNAPAEETVVKTRKDWWIVKRTNNWRHFYVIINKSSTLLEVTEEARRLFDEHAKDVFFDK